MSSNSVDPSGNTEAFRAFTELPEPTPASSKKPLLVAGAIGAVVLLALVAWLALR